MTPEETEEYEGLINEVIQAVADVLEGDTDLELSQPRALDSLSEMFDRLINGGKSKGYALGVIFSAGFVMGIPDDECDDDCEVGQAIAEFDADSSWGISE